MVSFWPRISTSSAFFIMPSSVRQIQASELTENFVQFFPELSPLTLVLPDLALQVVPFAFLLLQSLFERFLFLFDSFVLLNEPINLCFELFNMIEGHVLAPETSGLSLVLSSCLVKPRFRQPRFRRST